MKISTKKITLIAFGIAINIIGGYIAVNLKLPIYLDSIGTIFIAFLLGPTAGIITGLLGSATSGILFDIYSLYFAPVQIITGFLSGYMFKKELITTPFKTPVKFILNTIILGFLVSLLGAILTAFIFGGVTSAGSSYIIVVLNKLGVNPVVSAFITQFITDYADKLVAILIGLSVVRRLPKNFGK